MSRQHLHPRPQRPLSQLSSGLSAPFFLRHDALITEHLPCLKQCPKSARCPNGGPPIFDAKSVSGVLVVEGAVDTASVAASIASTLGVDARLVTLLCGPELLPCDSPTATGRRLWSSVSVTFEVVVAASESAEVSQSPIIWRVSFE